MNNINIAVPQTVEVPLEPIVEAVRKALYSVSAPIDDVMENITSGGSLAKAVESIVDDYDFTITFEKVVNDLGCVTDLDIDDYREDVERIVETWFEYSFDLDNYSDDIDGRVDSALSDRGWDNIDPSEFATVADYDALTARISELESRVERLVSALQNAVRAYSVDGGAQ